MIVAILVLGWLYGALMFTLGTMWATRAPRPLPPPQPSPVFRRVARPCIVARVNLPEADFVAVSADYVAKRDEFPPADRAVLDMLVLHDALMRGKW